MQAHREAIDRLTNQYELLQTRIDQAYEDKLDGTISAEFFTRKSKAWRKEQATIRKNLAAHENADEAYTELGITLLELGNNALELFEWADVVDKRKLLEFLCLNSFWVDGELEVVWRKPWVYIAEATTADPTKTAPDGEIGGRFEKWLPSRGLVAKRMAALDRKVAIRNGHLRTLGAFRVLRVNQRRQREARRYDEARCATRLIAGAGADRHRTPPAPYTVGVFPRHELRRGPPPSGGWRSR